MPKAILYQRQYLQSDRQIKNSNFLREFALTSHLEFRMKKTRHIYLEPQTARDPTKAEGNDILHPCLDNSLTLFGRLLDHRLLQT